ncbi:hypothetical protein Tco_0658233 [Tanacetum coccineum]
MYPEYLAPYDEEVPIEDQPYVVVDSPIALSPGYVADSDPEEDSEDGPEREEKHQLWPNLLLHPLLTMSPFLRRQSRFKTDEFAATPPSPPAYHTTARISIRPEAPMPFPSEEKVERLLALPPPPPSPLISLSPPFAKERLAREDIPEAELPPRKRLCLTALTSRYEVGESSTATPRPTRGHGIDYGFIGTLDAETRRQRAEEETQLFQRVYGLVEDRQFHYETARLLDQEALVSREAWAHSVGLSSAIHYELQAYRTHTQMQDFRTERVVVLSQWFREDGITFPYQQLAVENQVKLLLSLFLGNCSDMVATPT